MRCTICSERFYHGGKSGKAPKRALIVLGILAVIAIALALTAFWWTSSYYLADETALAVIAERIVVEGGNHASFGNYGEQEGDGTATISREQQQKEAADAIEALAKAA